jgi:hypothetical protein
MAAFEYSPDFAVAVDVSVPATAAEVGDVGDDDDLAWTSGWSEDEVASYPFRPDTGKGWGIFKQFCTDYAVMEWAADEEMKEGGYGTAGAFTDLVSHALRLSGFHRAQRMQDAAPGGGVIDAQGALLEVRGQSVFGAEERAEMRRLYFAFVAAYAGFAQHPLIMADPDRTVAAIVTSSGVDCIALLLFLNTRNMHRLVGVWAQNGLPAEGVAMVTTFMRAAFRHVVYDMWNWTGYDAGLNDGTGAGREWVVPDTCIIVPAGGAEGEGEGEGEGGTRRMTMLDRTNARREVIDAALTGVPRMLALTALLGAVEAQFSIDRCFGRRKTANPKLVARWQANFDRRKARMAENRETIRAIRADPRWDPSIGVSLLPRVAVLEENDGTEVVSAVARFLTTRKAVTLACGPGGCDTAVFDALNNVWKLALAPGGGGKKRRTA